jgi:carboxylesterase
VFVSGLCLGAVLAIAVAMKYPDKVKGVVSLSTTLYLDGWRLPWYKMFIPVALSTLVRFYYNYPECEPHGIKNERTRSIVKKLLAKGDVGMNDFPMTGIYELLKLSKVVRRNLSGFSTPILLIHSKEDDLTSVKSAQVVYDNISSTDKEKIILYDSYHMVLYDNEKNFVYNKALEFFNARSCNHVKNMENVVCC